VTGAGVALRHLARGLRHWVFASVALADCRSKPVTAVQRARLPSGAVARWTAREILLEPVAPAPESHLDANTLAEALESAARAWNAGLRCDGARLRVGSMRPNGASRDDGHNLVVVLASFWCPPDLRSPQRCYDTARQAITHLRESNGVVREADIEINAVDFRWSADGASPGTRDLRAVLGHELGHVLGLEDACAQSPLPARVDAATLPFCASDEVRESIMYPDPTEPGRRSVLAPGKDAILGLCRPTPEVL